jgi:lipoate---protein ligase
MIMRYLERTLATLEENLALDEALLNESEEQGEASVLRLWESTSLAVVLGASCRLHEDVEVERCRAEGVAIGRRSSGGGTVLIGPGALNVAVILPIAFSPELAGVESAQHYVLSRLAASIACLGPPVNVQGSGDLTVNDRKVSGSAQRRLRRHVLVHASVLFNLSVATISRFLKVPSRQPAYRRARRHEDFLANLELTEACLAQAIRAAWLNPTEPVELADVPWDGVERLLMEKYRDRAWVERF